jgi:rhomboid protease GluP
LLDLNYILLVVALISPIVLLVRTARRARETRAWRLPAAAVLLVTGGAARVSPAHAGYAGAGAWLLLLVVPTYGLRKAAQLRAQERFARARRVVSLIRYLHPARNLAAERELLRALELAQTGDRASALQKLDEVARSDTPAAQRAVAESFRLRGDWQGLVDWCRTNVPRAGAGRDGAFLLLYLRGLGELGLSDELVVQFAGRTPVLQASPVHQLTFLLGLLMLLAFSGRTDAVGRLLRKSLRKLPKEAKEFWLATSEIAAGDLAAGTARLQQLRLNARDHLVRHESEQRLARLELFGVGRLSLPNESTVARFETAVAHRPGTLVTPAFGALTPTVLILLLLNVLSFGAEVLLGGSTNPAALYRLGALDPRLVTAGEYWRLVAALFLHAGLLHLTVNAYALYVLGTALEHAIGSLRFAVCYFLSGAGSCAGVVALWRMGVTEAELLVGASGAVMGVVGAWAGILITHRHLPGARRRLLIIAMIVVIQTIFDIYTPQVSIAAHLCGLASGFLVGLVIAPARQPL